MKVLAALTFSFLICGSAFAQQQPPQTISGDLQRVQGSKVALAYVRPGTNWSKYRTILLEPLVIPPHVRNAAPEGASPQFGESYMLSASDIAQLKTQFAQSFRQVLTESGLTLVDTPQADTLIVAPEIRKITLNAPTYNSRMTYVSGGFTMSQGGGSITMGAVLADGTSKTVVAEVVDRQYGSNVWGMNNNVTNFAQAREAFDRWASDLVNKLQSP